MTQLEPVFRGTVRAPFMGARDQLIVRLTAAWLGRYQSRHTRAAYNRDLGHWFAWCEVNDLHPLRARTADVDAWIAWQREGGAAKRSIARRVSAISSWYQYLARNTAGDPEPLIKHNPADTGARPSPDRDHSPTTGLTRTEADRLIAAADADSLRASAIIRLMLTNAVRVAVIINADVMDLGHDRGHAVIDTTIKGGLRKRDPLPPPTEQAIAAYLAGRKDGPLFATATGGRLDEPALFRLVRRLAKKAGVPPVSPHSLRHTAITEALDATHDLRKAQDLAGHADPRTTRLYDLRRNQLDGHAAYVLATRYGVRHE